MVSCQLLGLCVLLLAGFASAYHFSSTLPAGAQLGDTCTPRGRLSRCGNRTLINETVTELTEEDGFDGPNVCMTTKEYMTQTCGYTYQKCYRSRFGGQRCYTQCAATKECNGTMITFTKTSKSCCEGFAQGETPETVADFRGYFRRRYRKKSSLKTEGCPVELEQTVADCLVQLNLNEFLVELAQVPDILTRLSYPESEDVTIFAPSNEAIIDLDDITRALLFSEETRAMTVGGHLGNGRIREKNFFNGRIVDTLAEDVSVHIGQAKNKTTKFNVKMSFVNGVFISQANACQARNGIVHVVDNVVPSSSATIEDILTEQSDRFSTFKQLLDASGISEQLDVPKKSRTVFAPTNDAFDLLPSGAVECLLRPDNSRYLSKFVLIHISLPAEFTSTLSLRTHVPTFTYWYLKVTTSEGDILITQDEIPLEDPDLPATNGVIHAIPEAIVPARIDFERLCPVVTTSAPEPMTTVAVTTETVTTEEVTTEAVTVNVVDPDSTDEPEGPGDLIEGGGGVVSD